MPQSENKKSIHTLTEQDRRLMALLDDLPLVAKPWDALATETTSTETAVLHKLKTWSDAGYFRYFRALFNSEKIGFKSTLSAIATPDDQADSLAAVISESPFVSHNFLRTGAQFNLWFTLTCPVKGPTLEETIDTLRRNLNVVIRRFDTIRYFKISFKTLFQDGHKPSWLEQPPPTIDLPDDILIQTISLLQNDLPLIERPFLSLAKKGNLTEDQLLEAARLLKHRKILRRLGTIWNLHAIHETQNVMCAWDAPAEQLEPFGRHAANNPRISHCYQRVNYPDWPWKIYTVIHGKDRQDCLSLIDQIGAGFPDVRHIKLWTAKEYKQLPVTFDPAKIVIER
ncbi:MAG: hypothetical protein WC975_11695 [Phycisphaerae bacterium]